MILDKYLVITKSGSSWKKNYKIEIKERFPSLTGNQIGLRLKLEIPDALFERPILEATMKVPTEAVPKITITPQITDNIERIIREATGLQMKVGIVEHEKELPYEAADTIDRAGDFSNLQEFKKGQKVKFFLPKDPIYGGVHIITDVEEVEVGHVIKTDRTKDQWIHAHWFAPVKK